MCLIPASPTTSGKASLPVILSGVRRQPNVAEAPHTRSRLPQPPWAFPSHSPCSRHPTPRPETVHLAPANRGRWEEDRLFVSGDTCGLRKDSVMQAVPWKSGALAPRKARHIEEGFSPCGRLFRGTEISKPLGGLFRQSRGAALSQRSPHHPVNLLPPSSDLLSPLAKALDFQLGFP